MERDDGVKRRIDIGTKPLRHFPPHVRHVARQDEHPVGSALFHDGVNAGKRPTAAAALHIEQHRDVRLPAEFIDKRRVADDVQFIGDRIERRDGPSEKRGALVQRKRLRPPEPARLAAGEHRSGNRLFHHSPPFRIYHTRMAKESWQEEEQGFRFLISLAYRAFLHRFNYTTIVTKFIIILPFSKRTYKMRRWTHGYVQRIEVV